MIRRLAAPAVLAGLALLTPVAPAHALLCGGLEYCPGVALKLVLDTAAEAEATVEDTSGNVFSSFDLSKLPVQPVCIPQNDVFNRTCVP